MLSVEAATVSGVVTDSAAGTPLAGAKVLLRLGTTSGFAPARDSVVTDHNGGYSFDTVPVGNFRLYTSDSGFLSRNTTGAVADTAAVTVDVQLVKILYGSITGKVTDSVAGTAVAGAKVYLRSAATGGTTLDSAVTDDSGSYAVAHVQTGIARTLRAQNTGFITKNTPVTVADTAALTVNIQLVKILYGSITGKVTDSVAGTALAGAKVYLRSTGGGGGGGGMILDSAVTTDSGFYTIAHVQTGIARTLRAQDSGFITKNTPVTVPDTAALTVNIELRSAQISIVSPNNQGILRNPDFGIARSGLLRLSNFNESGIVMVFDVQGRLLYRTVIAAHTTSLALPTHFAKSGHSYIVVISQNNVVYRKQIILP